MDPVVVLRLSPSRLVSFCVGKGFSSAKPTNKDGWSDM